MPSNNGAGNRPTRKDYDMKKENVIAAILGTLIGLAAGYAFDTALDHALAARDAEIGIDSKAIIMEVKNGTLD